MLFSNRDKFDLIAIYDESSGSTNDSAALASLMRAIYERSFRKILRNIPMVLVGGLHAWRREFPGEVVHGSSETTLEVPGSSTQALQSIDSSPGMNGLVSPRLGGTIAPMAPLPSPSLNSSMLSGHARTAAESSSTTGIFSPPLMSPPLADATNFSRSRSGTDSATESAEYKKWVPPPGATTPVPSEIPAALRYVHFPPHNWSFPHVFGIVLGLSIPRAKMLDLHLSSIFHNALFASLLACGHHLSLSHHRINLRYPKT